MAARHGGWLAAVSAALLAGCAGMPTTIKPPVAGKLATHLDSAPAQQTLPAIGLIIDDLGEQRAAGERALALPGAVACAFLPHTPHARRQARHARENGHEVLLHLPLEPESPRASPIPTRLNRDSGRPELRRRLDAALDSVPHAAGVNNHQGSLLTQSAAHMDWLMAALAQRGSLYFVDSRTTPRSLAYARARAEGVAAAARDVFLDVDADADAVRRQWQRLLRLARRRGSALAIGHPYPSTLEVLERELPRLAAAGVRLVPPSELIRIRGGAVRDPVRLRLADRLAPLVVAAGR